MASLADVAKKAGVSTATASLVLRGVKRFTPAIERRVFEAARSLDYKPNRLAQALRTGRTMTLGLLAPDISNPFFPGVMKQVEACARELGYALVLMDSNDSTKMEREALSLLESYMIDGLIWIPAGGDILTKPKVPTVVLDRALDGFDSVQSDHMQGGLKVGQYALEMGHRRIALVSGPQDVPSATLRRAGILTNVSHGLDVVWETYQSFSPISVEIDVEKLVTAGVTLLACANDLQAIAAIRSLEAKGLRVPTDMSVVGFDDIYFSAVHQPPLTTVRQPVHAIAQEAVRLIDSRVAEPDSSPSSVLLPVELVERASVARVAPFLEDRN